MKPGDDVWRKILTASQFAEAIGVSPYGSRRKLWNLSIGLAEPTPVNDAIQWGIDHEDDAIDMFASLTGLYPVQIKETIVKGIYGFTPDAMVLDNDLGLEVKCPYSLHSPPDEISARYMCQIMGGMWLAEKDGWYFAVWTADYAHEVPTYGMSAWLVIRSDEYIEKMVELLDKYTSLYFGNPDNPPPNFKRGEKAKVQSYFANIPIVMERII